MFLYLQKKRQGHTKALIVSAKCKVCKFTKKIQLMQEVSQKSGRLSPLTRKKNSFMNC